MFTGGALFETGIWQTKWAAFHSFAKTEKQLIFHHYGGGGFDVWRPSLTPVPLGFDSGGDGGGKIGLRVLRPRCRWLAAALGGNLSLIARRGNLIAQFALQQNIGGGFCFWNTQNRSPMLICGILTS